MIKTLFRALDGEASPEDTVNIPTDNYNKVRSNKITFSETVCKERGHHLIS